ncbi:hypothetical protein BX265_4945 [Streptomyces sp. TLI_235]|nr:hypothetical protein [Streptomyces sp. TLI_235]PBC80109.1 hypothetical protein BX265_4945 [Streptomyces sp. TLI_235]
MSRRPNRPRRPAPAAPAPVDDYEPDDVEDGADADLYDDDEDGDDRGPEPLDADDADAFFAAEVSKVRPAVLHLYEQDYELPTDTPLGFALLAERHAGEESLETFRTVLATVFGDGVLDEWIANGITQRQLSIVLAYAARNMDKPGSATLADCARYVAEHDDRGKALNRAQRRAASGGRSSRTGRV